MKPPNWLAKERAGVMDTGPLLFLVPCGLSDPGY
jgi:hypothetical protein